MQKIILFIKTLFGLTKTKNFKQDVEIIKQDSVQDDTINLKKLETPAEIPETNADKLFKVAISYLGKDASPKDLVKDELGCAETVSNIIGEVFPDFPAEVLATDILHKLLKNSSHFVNVLEPSEGCVIVSPRTAAQYGHVGVCLSNGAIASNNSKTGKFEVNYNWETWIKTFGVKGRGLKIYIYKPI